MVQKFRWQNIINNYRGFLCADSKQHSIYVRAWPSEEPPAHNPHTPTTPNQPRGDDASSRPPQLDPVTAGLYEQVDGETFEQRRLRLNRQETMSFAPVRVRARADIAPYPSTSPEQPPPPSTEDLAGQAYYLDDIGSNMLPSGWTMDEHGYLQLTDRTADY